MPLHSEIHVDRPLANFAVEYQNARFIAADLVPFVPVNNKSDKYMVYTKKDRFTLPETIRGPKAEANEVDWSASTDTYGCVDHALREFLPDSIVANADPGVNPRARTVDFITDLLLLSYERVIAALTTTYASYGGSYRTQLSGGDRWDVYATSDPLSNIETGKAACFVEPNVCVMGFEVWQKLKHHPQILDRISGGSTKANPAMVLPQLVAELFEVDKLLIGKAKYNSSNKAQTASYSYVWGKDVVLAYVEPQPSLQGVSAWKTFRWQQMSTDEGYQVRTYRDEAKGGGGEYIEVETSYDEKEVCSDVAYLIDTVIS
jgi:hypothetical protein